MRPVSGSQDIFYIRVRGSVKMTKMKEASGTFSTIHLNFRPEKYVAIGRPHLGRNASVDPSSWTIVSTTSR